MEKYHLKTSANKWIRNSLADSEKIPGERQTGLGTPFVKRLHQKLCAHFEEKVEGYLIHLWDVPKRL